MRAVHPLGWVWSPRAEVELVVNGEATRMTPAGGGWHHPQVSIGPLDRYGFSLDGGPVRADPRSHWQPDGLAGTSTVVDHDEFVWSDQRWRGRPLAGSVIYELHLGTFTAAGTFDGAIERLPYLRDLGVTTVELMPVTEHPGRWSWGYDGVLLYTVDHGYGGPIGLKRFVDAAHLEGLAVLLDVVYNHFGPEDCYLEEFGPYTHEAGETPWGRAVNLDGEGSAAVREHVLGNAAHWFTRYHVDGLRLDATHALVDRTARHVLEELSTLTASLAAHVGRTLVLVAEDDRNDPRLSAPRDAGGLGLDGQWSDDHHHALHTVLTGERQGYYAPFGQPEQLLAALERVYVQDGSSAGTRAARGRPAGAAWRHRFVVCSQNHDQVGNRARGERLCQLVGPEPACAAATVTLLGPATPLLFQGEEWAASTPFPFFADYRDAGLRQAVRDGRHAEFAEFAWGSDVPDPVEASTYDSAILRWEEQDHAPHASVLAWYRTLLALRREQPALSNPDPRSTEASLEGDGDLLALRRGDVWVLVNLGPDDVRSTVGGLDVLASTAGVRIDADGATLPGYGSVVGARRASSFDSRSPE
jgi:maltooligosyltrehalose trehalohydrolase